MPRIHGTTDAQSSFLRAFRKTPSGPAKWPSHTILARWLRHPGFRHAWETLRQTLQVESQLRLDASASEAAGVLAAASEAGPANLVAPAELNRAVSLLRIAYLRQRFTDPFPSLPSTPIVRQTPAPTTSPANRRT